MPGMSTIFIIQKEAISMPNEEYFESFRGSPEEQENYNLRTQVESQLLPRYIEEIKKIASEIVEVPLTDINDLLEASKKKQSISNKIQDFHAVLESIKKL